jgi:hypothetical protein
LPLVQIEGEAGVSRQLTLPQHDIGHSRLRDGSFGMQRRVEHRPPAGASRL